MGFGLYGPIRAFLRGKNQVGNMKKKKNNKLSWSVQVTWETARKCDPTMQLVPRWVRLVACIRDLK